MKTTGFFKMELPETGDPADITLITEAIEKLEGSHKDSVNFYESNYDSGTITLTSNGGTYPFEYLDNISFVWNSPRGFKKGETGVKLKIGTMVTQNVEFISGIGSGDFVFSKYILKDSKFVVTSYTESINNATKEISDIKNNYEPKFSKNTGFNKNKSDAINSTDTNLLATSKAVKAAYDRGTEGITKADAAQTKANQGFTLAEGKEPKFGKKTGFNLDKSDVINSTSSNTLATSKAAKIAYDRGTEGINKATESGNLANTKEPKFAKNDAFNKKFGIVAGTVAQGNDSRIVASVPNSRKINGKPLTADISLSSGNVGAYSKAEVNNALGGYYKKTDKVANSANSDKLAGKAHTPNATANTIVSRDGSGNTNVKSIVCNKLILGGYEITVV